jgi:RNA polymerase sigma factor (sigma-70 family)
MAHTNSDDPRWQQRRRLAARVQGLERRRERTRAAELRAELSALDGQLVAEHTPLAMRAVMPMLRRATPANAEDIRAGAIAGLWEAVRTYDPDAGAWTNWAWLHARREASRQRARAEDGHLSSGDREQAPAVRQAVSVLRVELGRTPTDVEVAERARCTVQVVSRVRAAVLVADEMLLPSGDVVHRSDAVAVREWVDDDGPVDDGLAARLLAEVARIPAERDRMVLVRWMGLDGGEPENLSEIGRRFGVSRETARQDVMRSMSRLTHPAVLRRIVGG